MKLAFNLESIKREFDEGIDETTVENFDVRTRQGSRCVAHQDVGIAFFTGLLYLQDTTRGRLHVAKHNLTEILLQEAYFM